MKLPLREAEHEALLVELARWDGYVSSALLAVEAIRACGRYGKEYGNNARAFLEGMSLLPLDDAVLDKASSIDSVGLRSLDVLHLATALSIEDEIGVFIAYDECLTASATDHGLVVSKPGKSASG